MKRSGPLKRTARRRPPMPAEVARLVLARDGGCAVPHEGPCFGRVTLAHRWARAFGGPDVASNLVSVCWGWHCRIEQQPTRFDAFARGWIIERRDERAPAAIPVLLRVGWVTLTDTGLVLPWESWMEAPL